MIRRLFRPSNGHEVLGLLAVIFGGVALVLVLVAGGLALHTASFLAGSASTTGTVIELTSRQTCSTDSDHRQTCNIVHAPRVRFTTADGRQVEYLSSTATNPSPYHEGQQVEIRYRPDDPNDARIYAFVDLWLAPVIVGGIGCVFAVVAGILGAIAFRLRDPQEEPAEPVQPEQWQDPGTLR